MFKSINITINAFAIDKKKSQTVVQSSLLESF